MGQIRKHTIISSLIIYVGFVIGVFNILILFPRFIPTEYMGLTKVIQDFSILITSFATLGFIGPFVRFNPYYEKYSLTGRNDLLQLYLIVVHLGMALVITACFFLKGPITNYFNPKSPLFSNYFNGALVFAYLLLVSNVLELYLNTKGVSIIQTFTRELVLRLVILILIIAVILGLPMDTFVNLFTIHYLIPIFILIFYIRSKFPAPLGLPFSKTTRRLSPFILHMAGFGIFQYVVGASVPVIDTLVVGGMIGLEGVANYLVSGYIATLVHVPVRATAAVLGAKIALYWKENKIEHIQILYRRTSMSYLIFSFFLVSIILLNFKLFQQIIGKNLILSLPVIIYLVGAKIFEMSTGLSNVILAYSKKWKLETLIGVLSILVAIPLNIYFVGQWGILGAAASTLILAIITFSVRIWILYQWYGLFPFKLNTILFIFIYSLLFFFFYQICSRVDNNVIKLIITFIYVIINLFIVIRLRFSEDINLVFDSSLNRFNTYKSWFLSKFMK